MLTKLTKLDVVLLVMVCMNLCLIGYVICSRYDAEISAIPSAQASADLGTLSTIEPAAGTELAAPVATPRKKSGHKFETAVECGGIQSKIISHCSLNGNNCTSQRWLVGGKTIELNKRQKIESWGCLKSQSDNRILFFPHKGNYDAWTPDGISVSARNGHGR